MAVDITPEKAKELLGKATEALKDDKTKEAVKKILDDANAAEPEDQMKRQQLVLQGLMPLAQKTLGESWKEYGIEEAQIMPTMMMLQMKVMMDPAYADVKSEATKILQFVQGQVTDL
mmetsp:Transcript_31307/g.73000  ORF Transcript_31307/g.73000 Transcript_31307/m.73000 type:complete len:117 (+) Transcript_31307:69-419(+)